MTTVEDIIKSLQATGKFWISFTGDSITSCEWVHPNWREIVEYVLKKELTKAWKGDWRTPIWGIRTFNFAYDGATTRDILERLDNVLLGDPNLVISLMGDNDPTCNISVEESIKNVTAIADQVTNSSATLVWSTSIPAGNGSHKNSRYAPYSEALVNSLHTNKNLQLIDMYSLYQQFPLERFFTFISEAIPVEDIKEGDPDLQHPNQLGNAYIAKVVLKEAFNINFDPEKYIQTNSKGEKYPTY